MVPRLGPRFDPWWRGHPPHMSTGDFALWQRYVAGQPLRFASVYFDVALGSGDMSAGPGPGSVAGMWMRLTSFRADVVGETVAGWTLIELREDAGPGALGSLLVYAALWKADPPDVRPLSLMLVTDRVHPDFAPIVAAHGIMLEVV